MLSPTLEAEFKRYAIGEKLRRLRLKKSMGLVELGRHTDLSPALLSKIECARLVPTLPTLTRIALVFGVGLEFFFSEQRPRAALVRKHERQRFPDDPNRKNVNFHFESLDFPAVERKLNAFLAEFEAVPPEKAKLHHHDGAEFLYLLGGSLALVIGEEEHVLKAGDSIYFDATVPHSYRRVGKTTCQAITITVP
jgi:mannose-6-phosphate isomerase-like protein (cupin superfamily)